MIEPTTDEKRYYLYSIGFVDRDFKKDDDRIHTLYKYHKEDEERMIRLRSEEGRKEMAENYEQILENHEKEMRPIRKRLL